MSSVVEEGPADQSQFERNKILIRGLSEKTFPDGLVNFIEARSGGKEVKDVQMLKNGKALVTIADEIKGKYLSIEFGELAGISLSYFVDPFASYRRWKLTPAQFHPLSLNNELTSNYMKLAFH